MFIFEVDILILTKKIYYINLFFEKIKIKNIYCFITQIMITYITNTEENIKNINNTNTLFVTLTEFKNSEISELKDIKQQENITISEFPIFTENKKSLFLNIAEDISKLDTLDVREKSEKIIKIAKKYCTKNTENIAINFEEKTLSQTLISSILDGIHLGEYEFNEYKSNNNSEKLNKNIYIIVKKSENQKNQNIKDIIETREIIERKAFTKGVKFTKDLINTPPSIAIPSYIEEKTRELFSNIKNIKISSILEKDLKKLGAGGILSVGQASPDQSRFLIIEYTNAEKSKKPIGLVGKGVTYDTGGLSLKPSNAMTGMKKDMGGAATILGGLYTCAKCEITENIVAVIPLAENLISEKAYKPDDIVTMMNGKTVEITNTDAEGRLLLGDAMVYIEQTFQPRVLIDMATLTGACAYAIGEDISAVFATTDDLYSQLKTSAKNTDEPIWRLPLYKKYEKLIESKIADIVNAATGFKAGTIQAALFLKNFVKSETPWAHFDIAYSSFDKTTNFATGKDVRLLFDFIKNCK